MPVFNRPIHKIAVMRYRYIGDSVLTLPFLYRLRMAYPFAQIHLYTSADSLELMRITAPVNYCIEYEPHKIPFLKRIKVLKDQHYDRVYILKRSFSSALYPFLAGIPERIGFATEARHWMLTRAIPYKPKTQHEARCYLDLLSDFARDVPLELPELSAKHLPPITWSQTDLPPRPWIAINPSTTNELKAWPTEQYQDLVEKLAYETRATFFAFGIEADKPLIETIFRKLPTNMIYYNMAGRTTVPEVLSFMRQMNLVIGGDSGLAHIAALAKTPQVTIFGPTDPLQWAPLSDKTTILTTTENLDCQPCRMKVTCNNLVPCLTQVTVGDVLKASLERLKTQVY